MNASRKSITRIIVLVTLKQSEINQDRCLVGLQQVCRACNFTGSAVRRDSYHAQIYDAQHGLSSEPERHAEIHLTWILVVRMTRHDSVDVFRVAAIGFFWR